MGHEVRQDGSDGQEDRRDRKIVGGLVPGLSEGSCDGRCPGMM